MSNNTKIKKAIKDFVEEYNNIEKSEGKITEDSYCHNFWFKLLQSAFNFNDLNYLNFEKKVKDKTNIPFISKELIDYLIDKTSYETDWSLISPTIFGSIFESTLNQETRRKDGMHYTSIENIHKVIDPLFLDDLKMELNEILEYKQENVRNAKLREFQDKISSLTFLDPACGSGNFLIETYLSLRDLEDKVLIRLYGANDKDQFERKLVVLDSDPQVKVSINQFYGIEINDFAVDVAKTALWIAEYQCLQKTLEKGIRVNEQTLPLKSNNNIIVANALRMDWNDLIHNSKLNYIMGNPPFVGAMFATESQTDDLRLLFDKRPKGLGEWDYVVGWYVKSLRYINKNTNTTCALVSTNSLVQGQQAIQIWKLLFGMGLEINFAYRTFIWNAESNDLAHVHCVIIGFSFIKNNNKFIWSNGNKIHASNINQYLLDDKIFFIESRSVPLCNVKKMNFGNMPRDGGNFIISPDIYDSLDNNTKQYCRIYMGAEEFINNKRRYCLWLKDVSPNIIKNNKFIHDRVNAVAQFRNKSKAKATRDFANTPTLFCQITQPVCHDYILIPRVSSEKRSYVPIGYLNGEVIASDAVQIIPSATIYDFGILTSILHNAWMRVVAGRLESRYRYSKDIVYNNFVWVKPTEEQKEKIENTAQSILDARSKYPDCSLADLYDSLTMPIELKKAHKDNDNAVLELYGLSKNSSEEEMVKRMFELYEAKVSGVNNTGLELL